MKAATSSTRNARDTTSQSTDMTDRTGADFHSLEVLTSLHVSDPITRVTRARRARGQERTR
ncbi:hypothetical protein [Streptomyces sp. NPDC004579]|uniref:hypothetical protein n=1 Tax=Streptomyces sp. NPDC004579 TaxID=3154667 RepID=UPI0033B0A693